MTETEAILKIIKYWAIMYGVSVDYAQEIAFLESSLNPFAVGDNGAAVGLYQWHDTSIQYVLRKMVDNGELQCIPEGDVRRDVQLSTRAAMYAMGVLDLDRWWSTANKARRNVRKQRRERKAFRCLRD